MNLLGGVIEKYYGPFGTANAQGQQLTGFGRNFTYDTRMTRGFTPPYFPTTNLFMVTSGAQTLAGVKPTWRETTPPEAAGTGPPPSGRHTSGHPLDRFIR